jgi:glycerophosphoryl diester phosphodiesterase
MNIHIKSRDNKNPLPESYLKKIISLIDIYDCDKYVYFMTGNDEVLKQLGRLAPHLKRCVGGGDDKDRVVERAIELGCEMVQFFKQHITPEKVELAHQHGIICNYFYCDTVEKANYFLDMGIDTILTNDYQRIYNAVSDRLGKGAKIPSNNN